MTKGKKLTTEEFINEARKIHSNKYDYSNTEYQNVQKTIIINCKIHGAFQTIPQKHLTGSICPSCLKAKRKKEFIEKAQKVHGDRYGYSLVEYKGAHTKIIIVCKEHGNFKQDPSNHLKGSNCPICSTNVPLRKEKFIEKAQNIHGKKYDYSLVKYKNIHSKVIIICKKHGKFLQAPNNHIFGQGCPLCSSRLPLGNEKFIEKAKKIHGSRYDYSLVEYKNGYINVIIICSKHGKFKQLPTNHLKNGGCPLCSSNSPLGKEKFIERAIKTHGNRYDYSLAEYKNTRTKVLIICKKHGKFEQAPSSHLSGSGCPQCTKNISKAETKWLNYLNIPQNFRQKIIYVNGNRYKLDAIDKENKIIWEFYGDYWHGNPNIYKHNKINKISKKTFGELYQNTIKKEKELIAAGYKIISIWENEWNKIAKTIKI